MLLINLIKEVPNFYKGVGTTGQDLQDLLVSEGVNAPTEKYHEVVIRL